MDSSWAIVVVVWAVAATVAYCMAFWGSGRVKTGAMIALGVLTLGIGIAVVSRHTNSRSWGRQVMIHPAPSRREVEATDGDVDAHKERVREIVDELDYIDLEAEDDDDGADDPGAGGDFARALDRVRDES